MMLKEQLLQEAKDIKASVELDSVFESVELSEDVKANFSAVFEAAVKTNAVRIAENHIIALAEKAEEEVEKNKEKAEEEAEKKISESASKFLDYIAEEWMKENQIAVDRGIKAELFDSMFEGLKELFVEHNVTLPNESVDVVAELEEALAEEQEQTAKLFEANNSLNTKLTEMKRTDVLEKATAALTESQKDKVTSLVEGIDFSDKFGSKVDSIVKMVKESGSAEKSKSESVNENSDINKSDADKLNFISEQADETTTTSSVDAYLRAATRLSY